MKIFQLPSQAELSNEVMVNASNWSQVHSGFHDELTSVYQWIQDNLSASSLYRNKEGIDKITACIYKYTGIKVKVSQQYKFFAMMPPDLNKNHVLIDTIQKPFYSNREVKKATDELRASVDIKNFRVSGSFSNIEVELFLDPDLIFRRGFRAAELSAITLHETGHMFSYFALAAEVASVNLPMVTLINQITKTEQDDKIEIILKEWNGRDEVMTKVDVSELKGKKKEVIVTALVTNQIKDTRAIANTGDYDGINSEFLADNFTSRLGAGADVVSGLDKIYAIYGHKNRGGFIRFALDEFVTVLEASIYVWFGLSTLSTIIGPILFFGWALSIIAIGTTNANDGTYDTIVRRYQRIREDMVVMLKDKEIDKAIGNRIRDDIKRVDEILKRYSTYKSVIGRLVDLVIPVYRRRVTQAEFYKELEQLSANNLFLASYDLRNLE